MSFQMRLVPRSLLTRSYPQHQGAHAKKRVNAMVKYKQQTYFKNNCRNFCAIIGSFLWSISGRKHEFVIYAMRQRVRVDNLTI